MEKGGFQGANFRSKKKGTISRCCKDGEKPQIQPLMEAIHIAWLAKSNIVT